ncbi:MAG: protein kinase [Phycicoccus sp.]|nr:protein kinase [Phycicoccus sp.]
MSAQTCQQPGCSGTIVDGYCDVCGMPSGAAASAAPAPAEGARCQQPGCTGSIVDGFCDVCGMPPDGVASTPTAPSPVVVAPEDLLDAPTVGSASVALGSAPVGSALAGTGATRRLRSGSQRIRSARLGAGLTTIPPAPPVDPVKAIKLNPSVSESKRSCANCGNPVGRSVDGKPGREEGFCPKCGMPFSFTPKLKAGDLVAGQYEVAGALAHGGLGWIYLARDRNVSDRWVVLKGLLNSGDPDALAAAIAEQRFLAQVEHPLIVEIYNFVTHDEAGYIVMEYVGGTSLKDELKDRMARNNGAYDPLPVDQALAFLIEVLPAFQYLHDRGLVYCDFKPDNIIQVGDAVKLIDLGGVRHVDDQDSAIYGTVGYQAPEVAEVGPSVASDIWTIGRTLLVLCMEFRGYQTTYLNSLPDPKSTPLFREHDSLYWLIAKCCALDPDDRFASAEELRNQALGVLREIVAARTEGTALTSAASRLFMTPTVSTSSIDWSQLPELRPDDTDPRYSWLQSLAASPGDTATRLELLRDAPSDSAEVWLARGAEHLRAGDSKAAADAAAALLVDDPWDWRALWLTGLAAMQKGDFAWAQQSFNAVYRQVPGELAPKLALAVACEGAGEPAVAEGLYATCAATDAAYLPPAAFGLARLRAARGDTVGAVAALDLVPPTSRGYGEARRTRADVILAAAGTDLAALNQALGSVSSVRMDSVDRDTLNVRIYGQALDAVLLKAAPEGVRIGEVPAEKDALRAVLEKSYRSLAREAATREERIALVDRANEVRPWTLT